MSMQQLAFELAQPEPATFANFVAGGNGEAIHALRGVAEGVMPGAGMLLWGATGSGRSHLLQAAVAAAAAAGRSALYVSDARAAPLEPPDAAAVVAVDDIDAADAIAQGHLFTLFNRLVDTGGHFLGAAALPPARLALRDDLRSRLGAGLVYEVVPLADADKPAALVAYARERGIGLGEDVIAYLLAHGRRDMPSLVAALAALDRHSLSAKRAITVPLLREWLQRDWLDRDPATDRPGWPGRAG